MWLNALQGIKKNEGLSLPRNKPILSRGGGTGRWLHRWESLHSAKAWKQNHHHPPPSTGNVWLSVMNMIQHKWGTREEKENTKWNDNEFNGDMNRTEQRKYIQKQKRQEEQPYASHNYSKYLGRNRNWTSRLMTSTRHEIRNIIQPNNKYSLPMNNTLTWRRWSHTFSFSRLSHT